MAPILDAQAVVPTVRPPPPRDRPRVGSRGPHRAAAARARAEGAAAGDAARLAAAPRLASLVVCCFDGPATPPYLVGAPLFEAVPVLPVLRGHALSAGLLRPDGRLT